MFFGELILISITYDQLHSNLSFSLMFAGNALSIATNAITTMMIAYKLWYVAVMGFTGSSGSLQVILQEPPYIHRADSGLEWTKEPSADRVGSSRRIRPRLLRIPGQSLLYFAC